MHRAYGGVAIPNDASIALHLRFGFEPVGTIDGEVGHADLGFAEVGFKLGRYWDVAWFERAC